MPATSPKKFIEYTAIVVYEPDKAKELFALNPADLRHELCRTFDRLRLPHPSAHNLREPNADLNSIEMVWYTEDECTVLSVMVEGAFKSGYHSASRVSTRRSFEIREMRVRQRDVYAHELPKKDHSRLVKTKASSTSTQFKTSYKTKKPTTVDENANKDTRPKLTRHTATIIYERDRASRLFDMDAAARHAAICADLEKLRLPMPAAHNMREPDVARNSVSFCWYTEHAQSILSSMVDLAFDTLYDSAEHIAIRKSLGIFAGLTELPKKEREDMGRREREERARRDGEDQVRKQRAYGEAAIQGREDAAREWKARLVKQEGDEGYIGRAERAGGSVERATGSVRRPSGCPLDLPPRPEVEVYDRPPQRAIANLQAHRRAAAHDLDTPTASHDPDAFVAATQSKLALLRTDPRMRTHLGDTTLELRSTHMLQDTYAHLAARTDADLKRYMHVYVDGEHGGRAFGIWLRQIQRELQKESTGLFRRVSPGDATLELCAADGPSSGAVAGTSSWAEADPSGGTALDHFRFAGRCFGVAFFYRRVWEVPLAPAFFAALTERPPTLDSMRAVDVELYRSLCWMLENDITGHLFEDFTLTEDAAEFTVADGLRTVELVPGGKHIMVTESNKRAYVDARVEYRLLGRVRREMNAFRDGLAGFIPLDLLRRFTEEEIALVFCGPQPLLSVPAWERTAQYRGYAPSDPVIGWFWECVRGWDTARRERLLFFVTGSARVPAAPHERARGAHERMRVPCAPPALTIERAGDASALPTSHACAATLHLPPYPDRGTLERKLRWAVEESQEVIEDNLDGLPRRGGGGCLEGGGNRPEVAGNSSGFSTVERCLGPRGPSEKFFAIKAEVRQELMERLLTDASRTSGSSPQKGSEDVEMREVHDADASGFGVGATHDEPSSTSHQKVLTMDPGAGTRLSSKRPRLDDVGDGRKRRRLQFSAPLGSGSLQDVLEEELLQTRAYLEKLRAQETLLFMQLTAATLPPLSTSRDPSPPCTPSTSTQVPSPPEVPPHGRWKGSQILSPRQEIAHRLVVKERELEAEKTERKAAEQTLEDVRREIEAPYVAYMLLGALDDTMPA